MNRLTNAAKYAAIIMSLIVTVTMVSGCKKNNTDVSSELNKLDIEETSQDMTGSGIEDSDAGSQSAEETAETESTEQTESDFEENTEQIETDAGQEETQNPYIREKEPYTGVPVYENLEHIYMNTTWEYADHSAISDVMLFFIKRQVRERILLSELMPGMERQEVRRSEHCAIRTVLLRVQEAVRRLALRQQRRCQAE